jgi:tRNA/rRNA methyltransferase
MFGSDFYNPDIFLLFFKGCVMNSEMLGRVLVVLSDPKDSKNVGAVCRAMKNMGLFRLAIAGTRTYDTDEVRALSVHAFDLFERASFHENLHAALKGVSFAAGITRRRGKFRKYFSLSPRMLVEKIVRIKNGGIALVFGNEESGLDDEELALCNVAVHIPSSELFPSLNLSHAVQVIAYEIFNACDPADDSGFSPVASERLDRLTGEVVSALEALGFFTQVRPFDMAVFFRDIFGRAMLDEKEAERLFRIFRKIEGIACAKLPAGKISVSEKSGET